MKKYEEYGRKWLRELLLEDEVVLWEGKPVTGKWFHRYDLYLIPFSILWCGTAVTWEMGALKSGDLFLIIFGFFFVMIGLYLVFGRFFFQQALKRKTYYAVTSKRILRRQGNKTDFLPVSKITVINHTEDRDGAGMITFGEEPVRFSFVYVRTTFHRHQEEPVFYLEDVPEAGRVCRIIASQISYVKG